jgi:hypothetical protein
MRSGSWPLLLATLAVHHCCPKRQSGWPRYLALGPQHPPSPVSRRYLRLDSGMRWVRTRRLHATECRSGGNGAHNVTAHEIWRLRRVGLLER